MRALDKKRLVQWAFVLGVGLSGCVKPEVHDPRVRFMGRLCDEARPCPSGLTCMKDGSFGGAPGTSSCWIPCGFGMPEDQQCPVGFSCASNVDGPGEGLRCSSTRD